MKSRRSKKVSQFSRRDVFRAGGLTVAASLLGEPALLHSANPKRGTELLPALSKETARAGAAARAADNIYTRVGVRPFINLTAALTIHGGLLTLPSVKKAMEEASYLSVSIDELVEKVGARIAGLMGAEHAIVTSGCAAALTHATAACVAGADPEKMQLLPRLEGLKDEVIMPRECRNEYDHAIRAVGVKVINVDSRQEFQAALGKRTAMVAVLGERPGKIPLEEIAEVAHRAGVPVLVDASAEVPKLPNAYIQRGADLVGISGGKFLAGPQCSGMLLGRKDLVSAAWINSSPHHGLGRTMKVGKEEIMGLLAAVETFVHQRKYQDDLRNWSSLLSYIGEQLSQVEGVRVTLEPPPNTNPHPRLRVEWDPERVPMTAGELYEVLLAGEPRIMSHADGDGYSFHIRAAGMKPGDEKLAGARLKEVFLETARKGKRAAPAPPVSDLAGRWDVDIQFVAGSTRHSFVLQTAGNRVTGSHQGVVKKGRLMGVVDGDRIRVNSSLPYDTIELPYRFTGRIAGAEMSGELDLGEHGRARWTARRA